MKDSCIVLLSSGLDSTVNLYEAFEEFTILKVLTFAYGQRAEAREIEMAKRSCNYLGVPHQVVDLRWMSEGTNSALTNIQKNIPTGDQIDIHDLKASYRSAKAVWVPNRNGVFLNVAAFYAEKDGAHWLIPGFNSEEAATFPDNSYSFVESINKSLSFSTSNQVRVKCYSIQMNKKQIFQRGKELNVQFDYVWSCYFGEEQPCGRCESCLRWELAQQEGNEF